jgi:RNA polymerase sigma-70 factor (ECF subfamily)
MNASSTGPTTEARETFDRLLGELRPKLHRYCARMTGSVIDGEDVVQDALIKAIEAFPTAQTLANPEGWLFRIAHNAALDHLRRRNRREAHHSDQDPEMIIDAQNVAEDRQAAAASLRTFMRLPVAQRSSVILMDVLGYSLQEIGGVTNSSLPSVKAALHRGRERLRELALEPDDLPLPVLTEPERARLAAYIDRFNAHDFDTLRDMLADDVKVEVVNHTRLSGRSQVQNYFGNYSRTRDWNLVMGWVDRRPAVVVRDPAHPSARPIYFILLEWTADKLANVRDFRYARYVTADAEIIIPQARS